MSRNLAYIFQRLDTTGQNEKISYIINFDPLTSSEEFVPNYIFHQNITSLQNHFMSHKEYILSLDDNWDGDNAKKFNTSIFERIYSFLEDFFDNLWKVGIIIPNPELLPNSDGSIDINWQNQKFTLLINIPKEKDEYITLFGKSGSRNEFDLMIPIKNLSIVLVGWMKSIQ